MSLDHELKTLIMMKNLWKSKLPLNKTIEIPSMTIVVWAIFLENCKHDPQVSLDKCLYKI